MTNRHPVSQFPLHFQSVSGHEPKFPSPARSTGMYTVSEAAALMNLPEDVMKTVAGTHMLPYNSLDKIRGIDMAQYLVKIVGNFDEVRALFELEGSNRDVATWVHQRREELLSFYRLEENYPLANGIDPRILVSAQSALLGNETRGNEKLYRVGCLGIKYLSHQPDFRALGEDICGSILPQCPHGEQRDVYVPLDLLVQKRILESSRGELVSSVQYGITGHRV